MAEPHPDLTTSAALVAEHQALLAAEAAAWAEAERRLAGAPGRDDAVARWSAAKAAIDTFSARLAALRSSDPEIIKLKAEVLAALHLGDLDFTIEAALKQAAADDHPADGALALSIARDVLAA